MLCSNGVEATGVHRVTGPARVIDGDTLVMEGETIRLYGVDAPETDQSCHGPRGRIWRCGQTATRALAALSADRTVVCMTTSRGRYGRAIARCHVGKVDLGAWMVASGWALAYRRYSRRYVPHECAARLARRGLWSGRFEAPWDHRRRRAP